jgi:hypothetical protein
MSRPDGRQIYGLLELHLSVLVSDDDAGVIKIKQIFLLEGAKLGQDIVCGPDSIKTKHHKITHHAHSSTSNYRDYIARTETIKPPHFAAD